MIDEGRAQGLGVYRTQTQLGRLLITSAFCTHPQAVGGSISAGCVDVYRTPARSIT